MDLTDEVLLQLSQLLQLCLRNEISVRQIIKGPAGGT